MGEAQLSLDAETRQLNELRLATVSQERDIVQRKQAIELTRRELASSKAANAKLTRQLDEMVRRLDKVTVQRSSIDQNRTERQSALAELQRQLEQEQLELATLRSDHEQLESALAEWQRYVDVEMMSRAVAEKDARRVLSRSDEPSEPHRRALAEAREASAESRRQNAHLRNQIKLLQRRAEQAPARAEHHAGASSDRLRGGSTTISDAAAVQEERQHLAQLREEHSLLLQREGEWREYCRATGRDELLPDSSMLASTRQRPRSAGASRERAQSHDRASVSVKVGRFQRENSTLRERIGQLAQRAGRP